MKAFTQYNSENSYLHSQNLSADVFCLDRRVNQRIFRFRVNVCVDRIQIAPNTLEHLPTVD